MKVEWIDRGLEPQCAPDPNYPNGIVIDASIKGQQNFWVDLPYPAKRCGLYVVECEICGMKVNITTAGRPDDPKALRLPCQIHGAMQ